MNWITNNANHVKNHPFFQNVMVNKCIMVLYAVSLLVCSFVFLPFLCFIIALGKTILYSHVVRISNQNRINDMDVRKSHEISNSWLIYCFAIFSYWLIDLVLGGIFLVIAKFLVILFVADMTFLKDVDDTTIPIVLFQIVDKVVDKYRKGNTLTVVTRSFEHFSKVTYPKNRLALYRYIMTSISHKMYNETDKKDKKLESHVDLNKSMMVYESPEPLPNPILVIKSITEGETDKDNNKHSVVRDDIDDVLSNVLTDMNENKNTDDSEVVTKSPTKYKKHSKHNKGLKKSENRTLKQLKGHVNIDHNSVNNNDSESNSSSDDSENNNLTPKNNNALQINVSQVLDDLDRRLDDESSLDESSFCA